MPVEYTVNVIAECEFCKKELPIVETHHYGRIGQPHTIKLVVGVCTYCEKNVAEVLYYCGEFDIEEKKEFFIRNADVIEEIKKLMAGREHKEED